MPSGRSGDQQKCSGNTNLCCTLQSDTTNHIWLSKSNELKIQFLSLTKRASILESSFGQCGTSRWRVYSNAHVEEPLETPKCLKTEAVGWENTWGLKQQLGIRAGELGIRAGELGIILFNMTSLYPWWKLGKFTVCTKKAQHIALNTKAFTNINPLPLKICVSVLLISNTAVILLPERSSYHHIRCLAFSKFPKTLHCIELGAKS